MKEETKSKGRGNGISVKKYWRRETDEGVQCDREQEGGLIAPVR